MKTTKTTEYKSSKTLKGQLFGALSMMLVAAIALGTSTYAWFINNRTVEVENMQLTVSTSSSMLVAVGKKASIAAPSTASNWTGYKSVIINQDITGVTPTGDAAPASADTADWNLATSASDAVGRAQNLLSFNLSPASISSLGLAATATGAAPTLTFFAAENHVVGGKLDLFTPVAIGTDGKTVGMGPVKRIPLKFTTSSDVDVFFGKEGITGIGNLVTPVTKDTTHPLEQAVYDTYATNIKAALRVAIVPQSDNGTLTAVTPVVFQFDAGGKLVPANTNNTDYQHVTAAGTTGATGTPLNILATQDEAKGYYPAIATLDTNKYVTGVNRLTAKVPAYTSDADIDANNALATVALNATTNELDITLSNTPRPLFQLKANTERAVDVYIWLEGTDQDCLNALSAHVFNLNLPFAAVDTVATPAP